MKYDFDEIIPRRGTNSYKWDSAGDADILPMWVADMDFRTAPPVVEALRKRVEHGIFGYVRVPDAYYAAVTNWFARRHDWQIEKEWIIYTTGVVPALSAVITNTLLSSQTTTTPARRETNQRKEPAALSGNR